MTSIPTCVKVLESDLEICENTTANRGKQVWHKEVVSELHVEIDFDNHPGDWVTDVINNICNETFDVMARLDSLRRKHAERNEGSEVLSKDKLMGVVASVYAAQMYLSKLVEIENFGSYVGIPSPCPSPTSVADIEDGAQPVLPLSDNDIDEIVTHYL